MNKLIRKLRNKKKKLASLRIEFISNLIWNNSALFNYMSIKNKKQFIYLNYAQPATLV